MPTLPSPLLRGQNLNELIDLLRLIFTKLVFPQAKPGIADQVQGHLMKLQFSTTPNRVDTTFQCGLDGSIQILINVRPEAAPGPKLVS